jgi:hypothetical protein
MSSRIPLVSNIVAGLMSQDDKVKLDALPNSITASLPVFSATTLYATDLVIINSNITSSGGGGGPVPDPLSSSIQRAHQFSASYFSMSSGSINNLTLGSVLTSSLQGAIRAHQFSASYFSMSSGSINNLTLGSVLTSSLQGAIRAHQFSAS